MKTVYLRWWLWVVLTIIGTAFAGYFGFFSVLLAHDFTYLGVFIVVTYFVTTGWVALKLRRHDFNFDFVQHVATMFSYLGILGTFIGLAVAFQAMGIAGGAITPAVKTAFISGVMTKFYTSIVGLVAYIALDTQIQIIKTGIRDRWVEILEETTSV